MCRWLCATNAWSGSASSLSKAMLYKWWRWARRNRCTGGGFKPP